MTEPDRCSSAYRVRFDECRPDGRIRTSVLLRYTQDLAALHSAARGFGRDWYAERGITWLVRAAEVEVRAPIGIADEIVGTTQVAGWRRVWARRVTGFRDPAGALVAQVRIDWVLLDARGVPTRIPAEFEPVFGAAPTSVALARVDLGDVPAGAARTELTVRPQELDPMDHVNNAVYADWLEEAVLATGATGPAGAAAVGTVPRIARLEYARAASPGARVIADVWRDGRAWSCRLSDDDGDLLRARLEPLDVVKEPDS
ncbi:MAG: acyl-[acyl-carrier-protein] thioesterase [Chloroflexota bacterium]